MKHRTQTFNQNQEDIKNKLLLPTICQRALSLRHGSIPVVNAMYSSSANFVVMSKQI